MLTYQPSRVNKTYPHTANPPHLDRVAFTIDHVHAGNGSACSTFELVRYLVHKNIPVTVFMQVTSEHGNFAVDKSNARLMHQLNPRLVTLGVHPLSKGHSQRRQAEIFNCLNEIIQDATGHKPKVLSYHGHRAGPEAGVIFPGIEYARGIHSLTLNNPKPMNTPVMPLSTVTAAFEYIRKRNAAGLTATFFTHSSELRRGAKKKSIFDNLVRQVMARRLNAVSYYDAMRQDFRNTQPPSSNNNNGNNNRPDNPRPEAKFGLRLSALTETGFRPLPADFEVRNTHGEVVAAMSNRKQAQFHLPAAIYQANARADGTSITQQINLTGQQGLHQKFLFPV